MRCSFCREVVGANSYIDRQTGERFCLHPDCRVNRADRDKVKALTALRALADIVGRIDALDVRGQMALEEAQRILR